MAWAKRPSANDALPANNKALFWFGLALRMRLITAQGSPLKSPPWIWASTSARSMARSSSGVKDRALAKDLSEAANFSWLRCKRASMTQASTLLGSSCKRRSSWPTICAIFSGVTVALGPSSGAERAKAAGSRPKGVPKLPYSSTAHTGNIRHKAKTVLRGLSVAPAVATSGLLSESSRKRHFNSSKAWACSASLMWPKDSSRAKSAL